MKSIMQPFEHSVKVSNKRYEYKIVPINKDEIFFECPGANIAQRYPIQDVVSLLTDLPEIIQTIIDLNSEHSSMVRLRVSRDEKKKIQQNARRHGYKSVSAFIRDLALAA